MAFDWIEAAAALGRAQRLLDAERAPQTTTGPYARHGTVTRLDTLAIHATLFAPRDLQGRAADAYLRAYNDAWKPARTRAAILEACRRADILTEADLPEETCFHIV